MDNDQIRLEHLKLVQNVITRVARNSAQLKAWVASLVAAIFLVKSDNPQWLIGLGGYIMIIALLVMDARYLHLERCYIKLVCNASSYRI